MNYFKFKVDADLLVKANIVLAAANRNGFTSLIDLSQILIERFSEIKTKDEANKIILLLHELKSYEVTDYEKTPIIKVDQTDKYHVDLAKREGK